jgi:hypothetical protein
VRPNPSVIVNRYLVFAGAFALAAVQPALTLGSPTGGSAPARPVSHTAARNAPNQRELNVPSHVDVQMKPLTMPQHFTTQSSAAFIPKPLSPYRRFGWQPTIGRLWYPTLYSPACAASNFVHSPSEQRPGDFTLGSLVDGKSNLLSAPSHNAGFAGANDSGAAHSNHIAFQAEFNPTGCGAPSFTNF